MFINCRKCKTGCGLKDTIMQTAINGKKYVTGACSQCDTKHCRFISHKNLPQIDKLPVVNNLPQIDKLPILSTVIAGSGVNGKVVKMLDKMNLHNIKHVVLNSNGELRHNLNPEEIGNVLSKLKIHGGLIMEVISIIVAIISLIVSLVQIIIDQVNRAKEAEQYKEEQARRDKELKAAEQKQKEQDLKVKLMQYNEQLGEMAANADMSVKELCIQQLKDNQSKVSAMKRSLLADAPKFNKTELEFVNYCIEIAQNYLWWNVLDLLELMKAELLQPGIIKQAGEHIAAPAPVETTVPAPTPTPAPAGTGLKLKKQRAKSDIVL